MANYVLEVVVDDQVFLLDPGEATPDTINILLAATIQKGLVTAKGDIIVAIASGSPERLPVGSTGQVLTVDPAMPLGVKWGTGTGGVATDPNAIPKSLIIAKGDLLSGSAANTAVRLGIGSNGQILVADSAQAGGISWGSGFGVVATKGTAVNPNGTVNLPTAGTTVNTAIPANGTRAELIIQNDHATATVYLAAGSGAALNRGYRLDPGGLPYRTNTYQGAISAISTVNNTVLSYIDV